MRVLITGVAGFIGSNLAVRLVADGTEVVGIDNLSAGLREHVHPVVSFHHEDIRSRGIAPLFVRADAVVHLAAKNCLADPVETAEVNVAGRPTSSRVRLLDQGIHAIDLFRWFLGDLIVVGGVTANWVWRAEVEDNVFALFRSPLGRSYGTESLTVYRRQGSGPPEEERMEFSGPDVSWEHEWDKFLSAIQSGSPPPANAEDGLAALMLVEAVYQRAGRIRA